MHEIRQVELRPGGVSHPQSDSRYRMTLVIPAYNEELRLAQTLVEAKKFLDSWGIDYEVVVVDDGSTDQTSTITSSFPTHFRTIRQPNRGKGAAVRNGILAAGGEIVAFTDADLPFDLTALQAAFDLISRDQCDVVFGSRVVPGASSQIKRRWLRWLASSIFRTLMRLLVSKRVVDTQCGLKVFSQRAARSIFSNTTIDGFAFDAEVVYLTHRMNLRFVLVPVRLVNDYGSTISITRHAYPMIRDVIRMRLRSARRAYSKKCSDNVPSSQ